MSARVLMVQGCTSDAGKSTLVAALCRWLHRQGVRVAPFKPQNMALNSAVTPDGGEIGRAQAVQAQACGLPPRTDFNPVLLKPDSDTGAQVIVHGRVVAHLGARAYHDYKRVAMDAVLASHGRLSDEFDAVLVEGAGSPAEINLRAGDIANMGYAEAVDCPVLLVADIDRGGMFAHLVGTLALLSDSERARVAGFVVNRFRGDLALLQPGLDWLERETGKPVLGVLPYLQGLHLEAEDALPRDPVDGGARYTVRSAANEGKSKANPPRSPFFEGEDQDASGFERQGQDVRGRAGAVPPFEKGGQGGFARAARGEGDILRIAVPVLPRISNHTDFDALRANPRVAVAFVGPGNALPPCDLIVLPGSKSTRADLAWLRAQGFDAAIARHLRYGGRVLGICGGLQMLGRAVHDPHGIEGEPGSSEGLGWLDLETTLEPGKQLRDVRGALQPDGALATGYEIHCGASAGDALRRPFAKLEDGRDDGARSEDDRVRATYLHGVFDAPPAQAALLHWAGLRSAVPVDIAALREASLERLADCVEAYLDTVRLRGMLGLPPAGEDACAP